MTSSRFYEPTASAYFMRALLDFKPLVAHITPRAALYVSCYDTSGNLAELIRPPPSQPGINEITGIGTTGRIDGRIRRLGDAAAALAYAGDEAKRRGSDQLQHNG
jgi:hypothetical protein